MFITPTQQQQTFSTAGCVEHEVTVANP